MSTASLLTGLCYAADGPFRITEQGKPDRFMMPLFRTWGRTREQVIARAAETGRVPDKIASITWDLGSKRHEYEATLAEVVEWEQSRQ